MWKCGSSIVPLRLNKSLHLEGDTVPTRCINSVTGTSCYVWQSLVLQVVRSYQGGGGQEPLSGLTKGQLFGRGPSIVFIRSLLTDTSSYGIRLSVRISVCSIIHNPCGHDILRIMWPRLLKLSMYPSCGKRKKLIIMFKVKGQGHLALIKN